jgi:hypothetical protein
MEKNRLPWGVTQKKTVQAKVAVLLDSSRQFQETT